MAIRPPSPALAGRALALAAAATLAACSAPPAASLDAAPDAPDAVLAALVDEVMAPAFAADALADLDRCVGGVAAVVGAGGSLVRGYGATVAGGAVVPDGATLFQLGSISKVLTGLILADEVEAGRLAPGDRAGPLAAADLAPVLAGAGLTLGELVSHRAGLPVMPDNLVDRDGDGRRDPDADPLSPGLGYGRDHLRTALTRLPLGGDAGYEYSNLGLGLLGVLLADRAGAADFEALVATRLAPALGLTSTWGRAASIPAADRARIAQGYALRGDARVAGKLAEMGVLAAAGEAVTSGDDLVVLLTALTGQRATALDRAILRAVTPVGPGPSPEVSLGYAFELIDEGGRVRITKGGATPSYTAYLAFQREPPVGAAVVTSCGGFLEVRALALALTDRLVAAAAP